MTLPAYAWALVALAVVILVLLLGFRLRRGIGFQDTPPLPYTLHVPNVAAPRGQPTQVPCISSNELEVVGTLGGGMYSVVAKGIYQGKDVAVKTFNYIAPYRHDEFRRQAQSLYLLQSPYLVSLLAVADVDAPTPQLVFEFMDRGNLERESNRKDFSAETIALAIARGLAVLHHYKVVHRDVRLRNVLVASDGRIKLADFGFARENAPLEPIGPIHYFSTCSTESIRASSSPPGTPFGPPSPPTPPSNYWVAPEGLRSVDEGTATDIFSLGVIMIEIMWSQKHGHMTVFGYAMQQVKAGTATADLFGQADWYHELALRCVAHTPSMRPSAIEIVHTIEQHLRDIV